MKKKVRIKSGVAQAAVARKAGKMKSRLDRRSKDARRGWRRDVDMDSHGVEMIDGYAANGEQAMSFADHWAKALGWALPADDRTKEKLV